MLSVVSSASASRKASAGEKIGKRSPPNESANDKQCPAFVTFQMSSFVMPPEAEKTATFPLVVARALFS